tara:strand:- start:345 stop:704 length:360 start_codon:yes stop_codon:yes gene_type:complete
MDAGFDELIFMEEEFSDEEEHPEEEKPEETNPEDHQAFEEIFGDAVGDEVISGNEPINWRREYWYQRKRAIVYQSAYDALLKSFSVQQDIINQMREEAWKDKEKIAGFEQAKVTQNVSN